MLASLSHAITLLRVNLEDARTLREQMASTALAVGDQHAAEALATEASDIDRVMRHLVHLDAYPETAGPIRGSAKPSADERGMLIVYLEALKLLNHIRMSNAPDEPSSVAERAAQLAIVSSLVARIRTLYLLSIEA